MKAVCLSKKLQSNSHEQVPVGLVKESKGKMEKIQTNSKSQQPVVVVVSSPI